MLIIGIDPGRQGAIAAIKGIHLVALTDLPVANNKLVYHDLYSWWREHATNAALVVIERAQPRPGIPAASLLPLAEHLGAFRALATVACTRVETPTASTWKRALRIPAAKGAAREAALRLFPAAAPYLARAKDHGRAEALLLAEYGRRILLGEE